MLSLSIKNCLYQMVKSKGRPQKGVHSSSGVVHGWRELICRDGAHSGWRPKMLRTNYCDFLLEQLSLVSKAKSLCQNILCCFCRPCRQQIKNKHPLPPPPTRHFLFHNFKISICSTNVFCYCTGILNLFNIPYIYYMSILCNAFIACYSKMIYTFTRTHQIDVSTI